MTYTSITIKFPSKQLESLGPWSNLLKEDTRFHFMPFLFYRNH